MASDQFSLAWDNFHQNMSNGLHTMYENEELVDVTIAVEGHQLKAHKMVLSVCSPYFHKIFSSNPCKHPVVFMRDVTYQIMSDLLVFMYQGEVQVNQENLASFIKTAESLQIKGLAGDSEFLDETSSEEFSQIRHQKQTSSPPHHIIHRPVHHRRIIDSSPSSSTTFQMGTKRFITPQHSLHQPLQTKRPKLSAASPIVVGGQKMAGGGQVTVLGRSGGAHAEQVVKTSSKARKTFSDVWKFFSKQNDSSEIASCSFCKVKLSYKSTSNNLRRHLKRKHRCQWLAHLKQEPFKCLGRCKGKCQEDADDVQISLADTGEEMNISPIATEHEDVKFIDVNAMEQNDDKFNESEENDVKFNITEQSDSNFNEMEQNNASYNATEESDVSFSTTDVEQSSTTLQTNVPIASRNKSSEVWKYFSILSDSDLTAMCNLCKVQLSYKSSWRNLRSHLLRRHGTIRLSTPSRKSSEVWNFFRKVANSDSLASCKVCNEKLSYKSSSNNLKRHALRRHRNKYARFVQDLYRQIPLNVRKDTLERMQDASVNFVDVSNVIEEPVPTISPVNPIEESDAIEERFNASV